jgi:hypothetical protein
MKIELEKTNEVTGIRIFSLRGKQLMLDSELAGLYNVETKQLNRLVKRNAERFPSTFMFQIDQGEWENLRYQYGTSSLEYGGRRHLPYVFTEQGVAMLSAIIRSTIAINISIQIMEAFVQMRNLIASNDVLFNKVMSVENKQFVADQKFEKIFKALEVGNIIPLQGVFYDGQIFDAYKFVSDIIKSATISIVLLDNYIDENTLLHLSKREKGVSVTIYSTKLSKQTLLDISKFNEQYEPVFIKKLDNLHDRFLIIDHKEMYHLGASLKDLGKKIFAFSKMNSETHKILAKLV